MRPIFLAALALAGFAMPAQAETIPYHQAAASPESYGYAVMPIDPTHMRVSFNGNAETSRASVEASALYRAAEVTMMRGYDYFVVVDRNVEARRDMGPVGPPPVAPRRDREITQYRAVMDIEMRRGMRPAYEARAFDAREVHANLVWGVSYPF